MHSNSPLAAAQYGGLSFTANLAGLSFAANLACGSLSVTIGYDGLMATTALPSFRSVPQARPSNGCEAPAGCTPGHDVGSVSVGCLCAAIDISERMPLLTLPRLTAMKGSPIRTPQGQPNRRQHQIPGPQTAAPCQISQPTCRTSSMFVEGQSVKKRK